MSGLLDNFDRPDNTDPGPNWVQDIIDGAFASHDIVSQQMKASLTGFCSDFWVNPFAAPQEAWAEIVAMPTTGSFRLYARLGDAGLTTAFGYELEIDAANSYISRADPPIFARTTLQTLGVTFAPGHLMKLRCEGTTITAWQDTGGGFVEVGSVVDATFQSGGHIGIWTNNDTAPIIDNFSGGDLFPAGTSARARVMTGRGTSW